jgi:hypothetical protein
MSQINKPIALGAFNEFFDKVNKVNTLVTLNISSGMSTQSQIEEKLP